MTKTPLTPTLSPQGERGRERGFGISKIGIYVLFGACIIAIPSALCGMLLNAASGR